MIKINSEFLPKHSPWYLGDEPEWKLSDGEGETKVFKKGEARGQHTTPVHKCSFCGDEKIQLRARLPKSLYGTPNEDLDSFPVFLCEKHESMANMSESELSDLVETDLD